MAKCVSSCLVGFKNFVYAMLCKWSWKGRWKCGGENRTV